MSDPSFRSGPRSNTINLSSSSFSSSVFFGFFLLPVVAAVALYQLHPFEPAPFPLHELVGPPLTAPLINNHVLRGAEFVGSGELDAPEDIAFHRESGLIYTGCADGWLKRIDARKAFAAAAADGDSGVENWFNTGGRPLGLAFGRHAEIIVADAHKGLLNISRDGKTMKLLTSEAEGLKFKLTDAVDVAEDGVLYFTDASYKYSLEDFRFDFFEGKPHGRLLSYDPATGLTRVLLKDLYFANGVVVSPDQTHVVFCETFMRRCKKYYIRGEKTGHVEKFLEPLPGFPDNILYDEQGHYWIALSTSISTPWILALKYPFVRKVAAIMAQYGFNPQQSSNAGVLQVDREGNPVAHYSDPGLSLITTGIRIEKHLYFGSIHYSHILRLSLDQHPATP